MAEKKNFTIENYNGTDYDTLYPQTNSGQVLLDIDAQSSTSLSGGSTVNDALRNILKDSGTFQIGDILTTARTNLGNKWLLCNGSTASSADYPELSQFFSSVTLNYSKVAEYPQPSKFDSAYKQSFDVMYDASTGKYGILTYMIYNETSSQRGYILSYQNIGDSSWINCKGSGVNNALYVDTWVKCLNNNFVVCYGFHTGKISNTNGYYCTGAPTDSTSFSPIALPTVGADGYWGDAAYYNGKYYFISVGSSGNRIDSYLLVYDDLSSTPQSILLKSRDSVGKFSMTNGKLCVLTEYGNGTATFTLINEDGSLGTVNITTADTRTLTDAMLFSIGQHYVLTCRYHPGSSTPSQYYLYFSDSLNSAFTFNTQYTYNQNILQRDDMLILSNGYYIDTELNIKNQSNFEVIGENPAWPLRNCNNNTFAMSSSYNFYQASMTQQFKLPTYSPATGLRAYIKAKN